MVAASERPVAFVSAGAGGAGRTIIRRLAAAGYRVATCDIDREALAALDLGDGAISTRPCDMADSEAVTRVFSELVGCHGRLDLLVNNVGVAGPTAAAEDVSLEAWEHTLRCNLTSHFLCCKLAIPLMKAARSGAIVNISSASAKVGLPMRLPYVVSKAAILSLTSNLARELGPFGIRVNAILPGPIEGARLDRIVASKAEALGVSRDAYREDLLRYVSMRTAVTPDDIADAILYLASSAGQRVSGQYIGVDGNLEYEA
jgi:NAD(P)-dependent dehydrogenase (short-subunit alcohol dehydrogenase family)